MISVGKYALGLDFGTLSVRALIVEMRTGREIADEVCAYAHGCMEEALPSGVPLGVDWALQHPDDYIAAMTGAVRGVLRKSGVDGDEVAGIGVDFTSCTVLPALNDGTPLCDLPEYRDEPHAYVKLWMHHAAAREAAEIERIGSVHAKKWMDRYSGSMSSESFFPKLLQIVREAPEVYARADLFLEAGDWLVWRMTGRLCRNSCAAGYKAMWHAEDGYPGRDFFRALDPRMENVVAEKLRGEIVPIGSVAGYLTEEIAGELGLRAGTPVAACVVDAHCAFAGLGVDGPGTLMLSMGTSCCHLTIHDREVDVPGMCGNVWGGILPGFYGYEAGQAGFGTHFSWFAENGVPAAYRDEAAAKGQTALEFLAERARKLRPGENGIIALDWWNGNRSILNDQNLSGALIGLTSQSRPEDIYRALLEGVIFGTRRIVESFEDAGVPISRIVAVGGIPRKNPLLMQICADILGKPILLAESSQGAALGAAVFGAVAAGGANGGYDDVLEAVRRMGKCGDVVYTPDSRNHAAYEAIYQDYRMLYDWFGAQPLMARMKARRRGCLEAAQE